MHTHNTQAVGSALNLTAQRVFEGAAAAAPPRPAPPHATASLASAVDSLEDMISGLIQSASVSVRDLSTLFDGFDLDGTGSISRAEFRKVLAKVGVRIGDEETRLLIDRFDADGNGRIEYREFVDMAFPSAERAEGGRRGERGRGKRGGGHDESVVDDLESLLTRMVRDAGYVSALLSAPLNLAPLASTPCSPTHAHQYPAGNGARVFPTSLCSLFRLLTPSLASLRLFLAPLCTAPLLRPPRLPRPARTTAACGTCSSTSTTTGRGTLVCLSLRIFSNSSTEVRSFIASSSTLHNPP